MFCLAKTAFLLLPYCQMLANVWFGDGFFSSIFLLVDLTFFTVMQFVNKVGEDYEYREHHEYLRAYYCGLNKDD